MKKILISVIIVLLIVLACFTIAKGVSIGKIDVWSVGTIIDENNKLDEKITEVSNLQKIDYSNKRSELSASVEKMLDAKEEYFNLAKISTEGELTKANTKDVYLIDYLWTRVGRHATSKGVNLKMDVVDSSNNSKDDDDDILVKDLSFTVKGQYIGILRFVAAVEDDNDLDFKIENFRLESNSEYNPSNPLKDDVEKLVASFTVKDIRIQKENLSDSSTDSSSSVSSAISSSIKNAVDSSNTTVDENNTTNEEQNINDSDV